MSYWGWDLLFLIVFFFLQLSRPKNFCRGRVSRLLSKHFLPRAFWRPEMPLYFSRLFLCLLVSLPVRMASTLVGHALFWLLTIGLLLDDYYFGDDDHWQRFKELVRNKVKWKMQLPQPVNEGGR